MTETPCQACAGTWPARELLIVDCGLTRAYLHNDQFFPGWTVLVLRRHATELFHLSSEERHRLIDEVASMAELLAEHFRAVKLNYELLGNQLPHIHWHLIPRLADDPAPRDPVWTIPHTPRTPEAVVLVAELARLRELWALKNRRA
jgi:diadenosine tetraphosphate (Ap4A) HIT family hydrolase